MENIGYLRRQAVFCLRLSELCSDPPIAAHLTFKAAQFHERALRAEFAAQFASAEPSAPREHGHATGNTRH